jgi:hypothetical protein
MKKILLLACLLLSIGQASQAQDKTLEAYSYKINIPTDWKLVDEQKNYNFIDIRHPEKDAFMDIRQETGDGEKLMKNLIFHIKGLASKNKMDVSKLTDEVIDQKLQKFKSEKGLNFLIFEHWERENADKKQRYLLLFITKSAKDKMVIFAGREIGEAGKMPEFYKAIRKTFEAISL